MKILCIIPARSGSKEIKHKNIKLFNGIPLLVWSIRQAKKSKFNMNIIVSTDNKEYKQIAEKNGAQVPFLRPTRISQDLSTDFEFIKHCLDWLKQNNKILPDIILQLRPTQPCRKVEDIDKCLDLFIENYNEYSSLRTIIPLNKSPYKMYKIENNILEPLFKNYKNINEPYNQCRQLLPQCYLHNGYIDICKSSIIENNTISGNKIFPYVMDKDDTIDIDTIEDWYKAEVKLRV